MTASAPSAGVVIPCYNEAGRLDRSEFLRYLKSEGSAFLLFVDDGSTDETAAVVKELVSSAPEGAAGLLALEKNLGKAGAVREGMNYLLDKSGYDFLGYWDADLATPLYEAGGFLEKFDKNPELFMVAGSRVRRLGSNIKRGVFRHYAGRLFATAASLVLGLGVYDTQCGAKLFRSEAARVAFSEPFVSRWIFDVEIFARLCAWRGREGCERGVLEIPLDRWIDVGGSKLGIAGMAAAGGDLLKIFLKYGRACR